MLSEHENAHEERCYRRHPRPGEAILRCNTGGLGPLPIINTVLSRPLPVVSVNVDTTKLYKPSVLLTFTGQINMPLGVSVTLNFIVNKVCENGTSQQIGGTFTFATLAAALEAETFAFQLCDLDSCDDCCTYTVEVSTTSIIDIVPGLTITNATLSALAVENC
jgi:hypothetical protein